MKTFTLLLAVIILSLLLSPVASRADSSGSEQALSQVSTASLANKSSLSTRGAGEDWLRKTAGFIAGFEGYSRKCTDALDGHATIGYGHLLHFGPCTRADKRLRWSKKKSLRVLSRQVDNFAEGVDYLVDVPINGYMRRALTSFSYNVGIGALKDSTLRRKLNDYNYRGAARQFKRWNKGPSGVLPGLTARRKSEAGMFRKGGGKICFPKRCYYVFA